MAGLSPYIRKLDASGGQQARQQIHVRGSTIFLRRILDAPNGDPTGGVIKVRAFVGGSQEGYAVEMAASEKLFTARQYEHLEIENESAAAVWIELYLGEGDFFRPVPDIVNVALTVPRSRTIVTYADNTNIDSGAAVQLLAENLSATKRIVTALSSNANAIRVGDSNVTAARGTPLAAGESVAFETTAAIYAISESADDQAAALEDWSE